MGKIRTRCAQSRRLGTLAAAGLFTVSVILSGCAGNDGDGTDTDTTADGREVRTALIAYSPFCDVTSAQPTGIEPTLLDKISTRLGLKPTYSVSDFAGQVASVQSGRNDLAVCLFYWTADRTKNGVYTDPVMYAPIQVMQREGGDISSVEQMEGKTIGSITGYSWNPALEAIPGATVRLYPEYPALLADVASGRVDVAPADALVNNAAIAQRPDWKLTVRDLAVPTPEQVAAVPEYGLLRPSQIAWYLNKDQADLAEQLSSEIRKMYRDGTIADLLRAQGADPQVWLTPPGDYIAGERRGVDRPADWQPPSAKG
jgi:ABC-type amino acid transport substrate-binding protein